jgi:cell division protein FtsL
MIRFLNFALIIVTGFSCLGIYRIAEEARIAQAELRMASAQIMQEQNAIAVLGAEWARLTQPARIQALAARHLSLADEPTLQLSSMTLLPPRALVPAEEPIFLTASIVVLEPAQEQTEMAQDLTLASYFGM